VASNRSEEDLRALIEPVALELLGEPNWGLSNGRVLRWGARGSLAVDREKGVFFDNEAGTGGGTLKLIIRQGEATDLKGAMKWLDEKHPVRGAKSNGHTAPRAKIIAIYSYLDEEGALRFQVVRLDPKDFRQRRPDGKGDWIWSMKGITLIPYRLPELIAAIAAGQTIYIVEGEKDVDNLRAAGFAATTHPGGAGKWKASYNKFFKTADVVIVADNDPQSKNAATGELLRHPDGRPVFPGQDHAQNVAENLAPVARRVRVLDLGQMWPECPLKGDSSNYLEKHTPADLEALTATLPDFALKPPSAGTLASIGDSVLAAMFAAIDDNSCYSPNGWLDWDGRRLVDQGELHVLGRLRDWLDAEIIPKASAKDELALMSNAKLNAIAAQLRLKRLIRIDDLDAKPWLLNTPDGTWDLQGTPRRRAHRRADLLTKITAVSPGGECPQWLAFLDWATGGDPDFIHYLQKLAGYALIGERRLQMFAFIFGAGSNGKGVFLQVLAGVMGDYAATMMAGTFLQRRWEPHTEELMPLRGARLVTASEVPEDATWNEARVKAITGGDKIRARGMAENSIEFTTSALLIMSGNAKPALKSVDEAIKRRIHLIEFSATVDDAHRDQDLVARLIRDEGPGILKWQMEGLERLKAEGLERPAAVKAATEDYLAEADSMLSWIEDACDVSDAMAKSRVGVLYPAWKQYALNASVQPGTINSFSTRLGKLGFNRDRSHKNGRSFYGIKLKDAVQDYSESYG